ncbi:nucleotide sugar dehydrogenase [Enterovirga rhinocerotis]|uniref:UDP-N-acetyl-D-glucosamine dehydrogenase n=1 Tax=Enterovirga rhinocerotis TaxID=1339210 RepID=A0A4R7C5I3_9HYPH|nr:nucleotide sugar dehydrogenase [Enterovirga rhinocerotis]TDR93824.1 UDP-N-acetyl-D-glucosamine dehydrogenase [Enterovirga rhinocerotis]
MTSGLASEVTAASAGPADRLVAAIEGRTATIAVVGLGYVGLPLAVATADAGFPVIGFDIDPAKIESLAAGRSYIRQIPDEATERLASGGRFRPTADMDLLAEADAILICVPTPLGTHREPDLTYVERTTRAIAARLRPGQLVVLESTTYPGTTTEVMRPILEEGGLRSGRDFLLGYSPEREDPGNPIHGTASIPKVVAGDGPDALRAASALYGAIVRQVVPVSSPAAAEAVKLTENIFRAVNIALVNELKLVYDAMGIDVWEVIEAASTKPFGYMPFQPGPGLGGHCIPIDPFYLTWKAKEFDVATRFIELAGEINTAMPKHVVDSLARALDASVGRGLNGAEILVLGLAYKRNVDDTRESPALRLMELIEARGARAGYHDPLIPVLPPTREHAALAGRRSVDLSPESLQRYDAVVLATDHDSLDLPLIARHARLIVDTRNAFGRAGFSGPTIVKA